MTLQLAASMCFFHERYFGRPSCPKCGELAMAPEYPEFSGSNSGDEIRNHWLCDGWSWFANHILHMNVPANMLGLNSLMSFGAWGLALAAERVLRVVSIRRRPRKGVA